MKKIRVTPDFVEKAKRIFAEAKEAKKETIKAGEGLSRQELRALERRGLVEKLPTFAKSKWQHIGPTRAYVWRLKDE